MSLFHLHIQTGDELIEDAEGIDFPDLAAAEAEAVKGARSIMSTEVINGHLRLDQSIRIHDDSGRQLSTVSFRDAVELHMGIG